MDTQQIAETLVNQFNAGEEKKIYEELYSPDIVSVEHSGGEFPRCEGMEDVMKKGQWWYENFEIHSSSAEGPLVADDWFSVKFTMDTTHKASGQRSEMSEIAVYQVKDGKIIYEEFFFTAE
tara:strand:- start:467 stop:829 length:363 start_codon:yes stop_codon:yes gene_type:complete